VTPRSQARRMPWKTTCPMDERVKFIAAYLRGEMAISRLCNAFGVSRKTAYNGSPGTAKGASPSSSNARGVPMRIRMR
jgi:transposase-like protein